MGLCLVRDQELVGWARHRGGFSRGSELPAKVLRGLAGGREGRAVGRRPSGVPLNRQQGISRAAHSPASPQVGSPPAWRGLLACGHPSLRPSGPAHARLRLPLPWPLATLLLWAPTEQRELTVGTSGSSHVRGGGHPPTAGVSLRSTEPGERIQASSPPQPTSRGVGAVRAPRRTGRSLRGRKARWLVLASWPRSTTCSAGLWSTYSCSVPHPQTG